MFYTRISLAAELGVSERTIARWEKKNISPVVPKTGKRTGKKLYSNEDLDILRHWMDMDGQVTDERQSQS